MCFDSIIPADRYTIARLFLPSVVAEKADTALFKRARCNRKQGKAPPGILALFTIEPEANYSAIIVALGAKETSALSICLFVV